MMKEHSLEDRSSTGWLWLCRAPLLVASALIVLISAYSLNRLVFANAPRNPWEATEVLEAWRSLQGLPVYELAPDGHSTHVYGALVPWVQAAIFRWVGPNNVSGRLLTLVSALVTVTLLSWTMRGDRTTWYFALAWTAILSVNHRSGEYFAENRPDMTALMFATAGVLLIGYGYEKRVVLSVVLGTAFLVAGFFFKQTAFIFAAVPLVALMLRWKRPDRIDLLIASFPMAVSIGVILLLRVANPTVYYYMIDVPKAFALDGTRAARCFWNLLIDSPLFLLVLGEWIVTDEGSVHKDPRVLWLVAALAVTIPFSSITAGKSGGADNSLLPALLAMMTFCILRLPRILDRLKNPKSPIAARLVLGSFAAVMMLMTAFAHMTRSYNPIASLPSWDGEYWKAVSVAKALPGKVICPEDPTIALYAKGYVGRNISSENDTHLVKGYWPDRPPELMLAEISTADHIVDVSHYIEVNDQLLLGLGFEQDHDVPLDPRSYRVWRRKASEVGTGVSRAAINGAIRTLGEHLSVR
jgi:4-amino-4-deoxy-L-arabinose transferase-like glycosyltransferase